MAADRSNQWMPAHTSLLRQTQTSTAVDGPQTAELSTSHQSVNQTPYPAQVYNSNSNLLCAETGQQSLLFKVWPALRTGLFHFQAGRHTRQQNVGLPF